MPMPMPMPIPMPMPRFPNGLQYWAQQRPVQYFLKLGKKFMLNKCYWACY